MQGVEQVSNRSATAVFRRLDLNPQMVKPVKNTMAKSVAKRHRNVAAGRHMVAAGTTLTLGLLERENLDPRRH